MAVALLDPLESTVRFTPGSTFSGDISSGFELGEYRRHFAWRADRQLVYDALVSSGAPLSRVRAFANCGRGGWVLKRLDQDGEYAVVPKHCHDRFCRPCSRQRSWLIRRNLSAHLPDHPCRFVTLTLRSASEPLAFLLDKLRDGFTKLRKHPFWSARVKGGAAFIEVKWSEHARRWHPHLHIICHGRFIPQGTLSAVWESITGTSFITDVRLIRGRENTLKYVTKYATKTMDDNTLHDPARLAECIVAMLGRKLCGAFGDWTHLKLLDPHVDGDWTILCPLDQLARRCLDGDPEARLIEQAIILDGHRPTECRYTARPPPEIYAVELLHDRKPDPDVRMRLLPGRTEQDFIDYGPRAPVTAL